MIFKRLKGFLICFLVLAVSLVSFFVFKYLKDKKRAQNFKSIRITFREGLNIHETAAILEENGIVKKSDFFEACDNQELKNEFKFLKNESKNKYFALEGYLFPDTYDFLKNEEPLSIIKKFLKNFESKTKNLKIPKNFSLEQILTIASFLEAESNPNDGAKVSSVIHNRLNTLKFDGKNNFGEQGFNFLQLDSTMYYPYRTKEEAPHNFKSIYNTYEIKGLPPGPICSPGLKFINDAINPERTDYYYFCNDKEGKTYFAKDYQTHCKNLRLAGLR